MGLNINIVFITIFFKEGVGGGGEGGYIGLYAMFF